ncbi:kinase-like domain-containing protein [Pilobolus umbonatus]|nr:kinase-like domain-containing protein [Pilobolus umbonatus]
MNNVYDIKVVETPVVVMDSNDDSWKTVPEFNITVKTTEYTLFVIRYIPDLHSFDHLVKTHYHKIKIPFPTLTESLTKAEKRRSLRNFFHMSFKSNADKVEKYLIRCTTDPILKTSTLLRDFFSPQREGDIKSVHDQPVHFIDSHSILTISSFDTSILYQHLQSSIGTPTSADREIKPSLIQEEINNTDDVGILWVPSPVGSVSSIHSIHEYQPSLTNLDSEEEEVESTPLDDLEMIKVLGKGCMGKVLLVRSRRTQGFYALKSIIKEHVIDQREITHTLDERNILAKLSSVNHPYLAKLHTSFQDEHRLYLLTDYHNGGDLATHMAKLYSFSKDCALFYAAEIIDGIGELHRLGILYRDLKPENILLTHDGHIILTDFGLSKWLDESNEYSTQTFCGTAEYLAPEVLLGESYSFGIDHWSFGTILYEMLAGITPFWADNHADMYTRVLEDPLEFPADIFDYETAEFLSDILDRDPRTRLGCNGVDEIKNHIYFADIDWDDIRNRRIQPPYLPSVANELDFTNFDPDFLTMTPALTPAASVADFSEDIQDIFDGYSFTDECFLTGNPTSYLENKSSAYDGQEEGYMTQEEESVLEEEESVSNELFHEEEDCQNELPLEDNYSQDEVHSLPEHDEYRPPFFQPARKRGSISMLSDVDSFCLDDGLTFRTKIDHTVYSAPSMVFSESKSYKDEEYARYAKRRNTNTSNEHETNDTISTIHTKFDDEGDNYTQAVIYTSDNLFSHSIKNTGRKNEAYDDLEFSKLPDLRLSFNAPRELGDFDGKFKPPSNTSTTSNASQQSKTRRFLSLLL